ncbi:MAG: thiamine pyrophosphokinase [Pedobacter sp.]|nr:MAG: thiamine pyrophosphokinase [Pedobacter sp.]
MSSHHIVREKQEPALYIHHLGDFDEEYLGQILEWSPSLIVNSSEFEKILSLGLKVDIVVNPAELNDFQENTRLITTDTADVDSVLQYLIDEGYPAVNLIDASNTIQDLSQYNSRINIVIFSATEKTYAVKPGFKVWKPAGSIFKVSTAEQLQHTNLAVISEDRFEVIHDGFVSFHFNGTYLTISEAL